MVRIVSTANYRLGHSVAGDGELRKIGVRIFRKAGIRLGLSPKEQDRIKKRHRETKILWKQEQVKIHAEAREEANRIWNESKAVQGHEYLRNKGVKPFGVRDHNGTLIVPLKDAQDTLNSLQSISPNGTKRFLPGGKIKGCYHLIGTPDEILYITEGYSTGATVHDATGEAVVVAFNAGNLQNVAEILRRKYGDISIVIAADNDAFTDGNPGLTKAKEAATAVGGKIAVPVFNDVSSKPTDFNDLCQLEGAEKVEKLLEEASEPVEPIPVVLGRLAALSPIKYDQCRKAEATRMGIQVSTLDTEVKKLKPKSDNSKEVGGTEIKFEEIEPWPDSVDGEALLDELADSFSRYVFLQPGCREVGALFTVFTYVHDAFYVSPILAALSPDKRCGKTTYLNHLQRLAHKGRLASNISPAAIFRFTEKYSPTLIIDEADTFLKKNPEIIGILNSGHLKESATIIRVGADDNEVLEFNTWAPKAIGMIGKLPPTLLDRSIVVHMRRKLTGELTTKFRPKYKEEFLEFRRKLTRWGADNIEILKTIEPDIPEGLNDRAADNWEPLLAIAEEAGGEWPNKAKEAIQVLTKNEVDDDSLGAMLLKDIKDIFEKRGTDRIFTKDLLDTLAKMDERRWPEFRNSKPISAPQLAKLLKIYKISAAGTIRI